ncbi:hypothetical protein AQUCO_03200098v1 [Aquilegia coerulea]|uniref:Uncharacterized protein n=1 Tax=Aquilegia coerulea TaxID=218851 RepID=A0A2G5D057_AQUCA|nr:hypothetical protein AQUCO_03200098v1 [Aquilegia coerulea]
MGDDEKQVLLNQKKALSRCISYAEDELKSFRTCLKYMCVDQSNPWRACLSWFMFFLLGILVPFVSHFWLACKDCDGNLHRPFDGVVQTSLTSVATVSFLGISTIVRKYGLRRHLFLNKLYSESQKVRDGYRIQLQRSLKILAVFVLPCFAVDGAYKIWWYSSGAAKIPIFGNVYVGNAIACIFELLSWLYRTSIFFLVCVVYRLVCYLQILRLQDFAHVFQEEPDVGKVLNDHFRIRRHLQVISHRYRAFILCSLVFITFSQLSTLLNTTRPHAKVNVYLAGELALCSMTLMAGLYILLRSATKITHRAQSVTSLAAKWHICATLHPFDEVDGKVSREENNSHSHVIPITVNEDSSEDDDVGDDHDEIDHIRIMSYAQTISFRKRQALVTYFENNRAGITVYGFMLDRTYLHTMFGIEMSLVLWLLGKTIGFS